MSSSIKNISLFIPHVFSNIGQNTMAEVFEHTIGKVNHIDFVAKQGKDGNHFNVAYIHFDFWHDTIVTRNLQERILNDAQVARVVYDDPWYWVVLENKSKKITTGTRKVCLDIGGLKPTDATSALKTCLNIGDFPALPSTRQPITPPTSVAMVCPHAPPRKAHTKPSPLYTNLGDAFAAAARIQQEAETVCSTADADQDQDEIDDWIEQELAAEEDDIIAISNQYVCMLEQDNNQQRHIIDELMEKKNDHACDIQHDNNLMRDIIIELNAKICERDEEIDDLRDEMMDLWRKDGVESKYNEI